MSTKKAKPKSKTSGGPKRAAIYVRVSSEKQAKGTAKERETNGEDAAKESPKAQERDCRELCDRQGYIVVGVYADTEKYRVNGRLVEPSGTRHDRPQLKRMLKDADAGQFDLIIAWREDRLYRGVNRAMLEISERVKSKVIEVELVKEHYDPAIAEVKAWAAGVELQAKHDRFMMGIAGRLEAGKVWGNQPPYGYDYDKQTGSWVVNITEKQWVRKVWLWFGAGESWQEIRQRLITAGVKQKGKKDRKRVWNYTSISGILAREEYYTGKYTVKWDGVDYTITVPEIIDQATYQAVKDRRARYKAYPAGNYKQYALAGGLVHCHGCGVRMNVSKSCTRTQTKTYCYPNYRCPDYQWNFSGAECARYVSLRKADDEIWRKVWDAISDPDVLEAKINERIAQLQAERVDAQGDCDQIQAKLDDIAMKRQQAIAWGLNGIISEDDVKMQMAGFAWQAASLQHELSEAALLTGDRESKLRAIADNLRARVETGRELLALPDPTPEQQQYIFDFKRTIIQGLVTRIEVYADKSITVNLELDDEVQPLEAANNSGDYSRIVTVPLSYHMNDQQKRVLIALTL